LKLILILLLIPSLTSGLTFKNGEVTDSNNPPSICKNLEFSQNKNISEVEITFKLISEIDFPQYRSQTNGSLNENDGEFTEARIQGVADFNNDGIDDIIIEYFSTLVGPVILYGTKSSQFEILKLQEVDANSARINNREINIEDINNDGFLDIIGFTTADYFMNDDSRGDGDYNLLLMNIGGKKFKSISLPEISKNQNHGGIVSDIDNNGYMDIIPLVEDLGLKTFPISNINGKEFQLIKDEISKDITKYWIEDGNSADLNNDGYSDLIISVEEAVPQSPKSRNKMGTLRIIYGDGNFDFKDNTQISLGRSWLSENEFKRVREEIGDRIHVGTSNIDIFDINADGLLDIIEGQYIMDVEQNYWITSGFKVYTNKKDCFADETDLFFPNQSINRNFENNEFTTFIGNFYHEDLNGDGFNDLIIRVWYDEYSFFENSKKIKSFPFIFINDKNTQYLPLPFEEASQLKYLWTMVPGDFNGDGQIDLVGIEFDKIKLFKIN